MFKKILPFMLAFLLSFAAMNTSEAGTAPTCEADVNASASLYHENFMNNTNGIFSREIIEGYKVQTFLEKMNATPSITDFTADTIYLYTNPWSPLYAVVLITEGCVTEEGTSDKELVDWWREDGSVNDLPSFRLLPGLREA